MTSPRNPVGCESILYLGIISRGDKSIVTSTTFTTPPSMRWSRSKESSLIRFKFNFILATSEEFSLFQNTPLRNEKV